MGILGSIGNAFVDKFKDELNTAHSARDNSYSMSDNELIKRVKNGHESNIAKQQYANEYKRRHQNND